MARRCSGLSRGYSSDMTNRRSRRWSLEWLKLKLICYHFCHLLQIFILTRAQTRTHYLMYLHPLLEPKNGRTEQGTMMRKVTRISSYLTSTWPVNCEIRLSVSNCSQTCLPFFRSSFIHTSSIGSKCFYKPSVVTMDCSGSFSVPFTSFPRKYAARPYETHHSDRELSLCLWLVWRNMEMHPLNGSGSS
ncbi:hypothetical protein M405DRAFT_597878 [Rhizopogon salebrosus TDB-379]|nr:hypothetical protein M405DRAFT_597878 [Rhizopogon salebrosus TDB-379]